ncbi:MAG TPA: alpha-amylase/4-alpha-glucanotransferase domain-containing protein [Candidatus Limnocylindrales bacterium]|nr:alpha-amylase/4-alpha-glucanotransferase domain-containing protein [Candidatus Limnocylindrales bacterium]
MEPRISLALAIHNHQPVGNFDWVIGDVYERAYRPMVEALERHPGVRLSLHYSGPLLEWLRREHPDLVGHVRALVERDQVEVLGGGWFEPILASLPERDRLVQLERMADEVEATFGRRPAGAWLAERAWEPALPTSIVAAGYRWTILDDEHFRAAAVPNDRLWGAYTTEDQGAPLALFASDRWLRFGIPFADVADVIGHLRGQATGDGSRVAVMGDDGEKLGGWPTTWDLCWGERQWVDRFFAALDANRSWLTTVTPSAWLDREPPIGRVYVPTSSYTEMGEWALPASEAHEFAAILARDRDEGRPEARWLRGGFWRNFQVKYREINDLHKQMLRTSAKVAAMASGPDRDRATDELGRGQSNDCYWHGLFGGIYLPHLRVATLGHLVAAEDLADAAAAGPLPSGVERDLDLDGRPEILLATTSQVVTIKPDEGAGIGSWDLRAAAHPLLAVMRRRPEAYHATLLDAERAERVGDAQPGASEARGAGAPPQPASIHDIVREKEPGLGSRLSYDGYERRSGLVHLLGLDVDATRFSTGRYGELLDAVDGPFTLVEVAPTRVVVEREATVRSVGVDARARVRIERTITISGGRLDPTIEAETILENIGATSVEGRLGVEWSFMLLGGGANPAAWWELPDGRIPHDGSSVVADADHLAQGNDWLGTRIDTSVTPEADAWISPIETISNSESGFERVYQGSCLLLSRPIAVAPGEATGLRVRHAVTIAPEAVDARLGR